MSDGTMNDEGRKHRQAHLAALAGLLHDTGKFAQRAGWQPGPHTQVGGAFVCQYVPERWRDQLYPVMGHHDRPLQGQRTKVVALADWLSAAEREEAAESGPRQLVSIFCQIGGQAGGKEEKEEGETLAQQVWPLARLRLDQHVLFPTAPLDEEEERKGYQETWASFEEEVRRLPEDDLPAYLEGLLYTLQRHTWCIPGAYFRSVPDVSLFDHSRTTAALAACLAGLDEATLDRLLDERRPGKPPADEGPGQPLALLVGGDLSGVQAFIYTITARGAAKGLRGRSFYLQLLTEAVARFILRGLALPITNLLYAGGGHFYLLAPPEAEARLEELRVEVSRKLLAHHKGDLYLALGWTGATAADFERERFGDKWREVTQAMNAAKRRRFAELGDAALLTEAVFGPLGRGGDEKGECQVCHYDGPVEVEREGDGEERRICRLCQSLEELGTDLRDADYLLLGQVEPEKKRTERAGYAEALRAFGTTVGLTRADGSPALRLPGGAHRATLLAMRDRQDVAGTARRISQALNCPVAPGTRYTVNVTPHKPNGDIATFDWLQERAQGVARLGVLRMDVDDLGDLFGRGIPEATLSRVASLSFALSLFFEGWVGQRCRRVNQEGETDKVYAIYSGGDDLFIVGAWDALPGLADDIRRDLARFAAGNPAVHISGGLTLHAGKYPLYQAAADAEGALERAKDLERPGDPDDPDQPDEPGKKGHRKDAFNFLGLTIPWEEFDGLRREKEQLVRSVTPEEHGGLGIDRALLRTLIRLHARFADAVYERGKPYWGPWMWQGAYVLKRMADRYGRKKEEAQAQITRIREALKQDNFRYIETLGPAARWAELLTRKEQAG